MIQSMIKMVFAPDKVDDAMQILRSIVERIRAEIGCVSCSVYQGHRNGKPDYFQSGLEK